jgi:hypothetical protein
VLLGGNKTTILTFQFATPNKASWMKKSMHFQSKKRMRRMGVPTPGGYCRTSTPSYTNRRKKGPKGFPFNPQILARARTSYERFRTKGIMQKLGPITFRPMFLIALPDWKGSVA